MHLGFEAYLEKMTWLFKLCVGRCHWNVGKIALNHGRFKICNCSVILLFVKQGICSFWNFRYSTVSGRLINEKFSWLAAFLLGTDNFETIRPSNNHHEYFLLGITSKIAEYFRVEFLTIQISILTVNYSFTIICYSTL